MNLNRAQQNAISIENRTVQRTMLPRSAVALGIVCPMANEGDEAVPFCQAVLEQCSGFQKVTFFAVFDRVTKDSSLDQMRAWSQSEPRLRVVWAPENRCVVDAYLRGYKEALDAGSDWILEIDAGFSHQPGDIPQFFTPWNKEWIASSAAALSAVLRRVQSSAALSVGGEPSWRTCCWARDRRI